MEKVAVIYEGKYGSTEQYAKWICEETSGDLFSLEEAVKTDLAVYDAVVFGGAIHAGGILGIDKFKKIFKKIMDKRVYTFAVGLNIDDEEARKECMELNFEKQEYVVRKAVTWVFGRRIPEAEVRFGKLPCWFFKGAYDPARITGADKTVMGVVKKMIGGKPRSERTESEQQLLEAVENGADYVDKSYIRDLVDAVKGKA